MEDYTKVNFKDYPDTTTPVNAANLDHMDSQILVNTTNIGDVDANSELGTNLSAQITTLSNIILDKLYPVGSIYLETTNTNPSAKLGGTWVAFGSSDTYLRLGGNGSGGSNTITTANLPSHTHSIPSLSGSAASNGSHAHNGLLWADGTGITLSGSGASGIQLSYSTGVVSSNVISTEKAPNHTHTVTTNASTTGANGSGTEFNPKYVQVYAWKRTA